MKRMSHIQQEFINQLRKGILQKKLSESFNRKRIHEFKRTMFVEFRIHCMEERRRKSNIEVHLDEIEEESNLEVTQIAFNTLKERVMKMKFKYIGVTCNRLKMLKRVFFTLQKHDFR